MVMLAMAVRVRGLRAGQEGVEPLQLVDQPLFDQEIQRAIDRRRRGAAGRASVSRRPRRYDAPTMPDIEFAFLDNDKLERYAKRFPRSVQRAIQPLREAQSPA